MNNNTFQFSDLLNESNATFNNISVSNLNVDNLTGVTATFTEATILYINGATANVNNITGITASFDDLRVNNINPSEFVGIDSSKRFVSRGISGTSNRINITYGNDGITLATPQDINITSDVTFNSARLQGATITQLNSTNILTGGLTSTSGISTTFINATQLSRFHNGITTTGIITSGITATGITGSTLNINTITINNLTANNVLSLDASRNVTSPFATSDITRLSQNNTLTGTNIFTNDVTIQNSSNWSRLNVVAGNAVNDRALLYLQSFGATGQAITLFCDSSKVDLFNNNTTRTIMTVPKTTDIPSFPQSINLSGQTASRILLTDASRNVVSGSFDESQIVRTINPQTVGGLKTFTGGITANTVITGGITFTGGTGTTLTVGAVVVTGATANRFAFFNANRQLIAVNDPSTNITTTNNTWTGTNSFTNGLTANNIFSTSLTPSRIVLTNANRQLISSSFTDSDFVNRTTTQGITGTKTFFNGPFVETTGSAFVRLRITGQSGFDLYTFGDSLGFGIWSLPLGGPILQVRNSLTANRMLTTDASNYLASASYGSSEVVITSTNQNIAGEKNFTTGIYLPTSGGTPRLLDFYERWSGTFTFGTIFAVNQIADVYITRIGTLVTLTLQAVFATAQTVTSGLNSTSSSGNTIPARFLGGSKTTVIQAYNCSGSGISGSGNALAYFRVIDTGSMTIQLTSGSFFTGAGSNGWDMCSFSWSL